VVALASSSSRPAGSTWSRWRARPVDRRDQRGRAGELVQSTGGALVASARSGGGFVVASARSGGGFVVAPARSGGGINVVGMANSSSRPAESTWSRWRARPVDRRDQRGRAGELV
jgi:hypothetical protein